MKLISGYNDILPGSHELTFDGWYLNYPKKTNKQKAEALWNKLSEKKKHLAMLDVPKRLDLHAQWSDKQYIPAPDVYLRNEKWTDEIIHVKTKEDEQEELEDGTPQARFWTLLKQMYGDAKVEREFGKTMPYAWRRGLESITPGQVGKVLSYLATSENTHMPTLPEVKRILRIGQFPGQHKQKLLTNPSKPETVKKAIDEMKKHISI